MQGGNEAVQELLGVCLALWSWGPESMSWRGATGTRLWLGQGRQYNKRRLQEGSGLFMVVVVCA